MCEDSGQREIILSALLYQGNDIVVLRFIIEYIVVA
jgi:hypothetical protein